MIRLCIQHHNIRGLVFFPTDFIDNEVTILRNNGWIINPGLFIHKCFQSVKTIHGYETMNWRTTEDKAIPWGESKSHYKVYIDLANTSL